jgi:hypothetical protein
MRKILAEEEGKKSWSSRRKKTGINADAMRATAHTKESIHDAADKLRLKSERARAHHFNGRLRAKVYYSIIMVPTK